MLNHRKRRAWWSQKQGLDGSMADAAPALTLAQTGWARSVGGAAPYLTLFARAGTDRAQVDRAVEALALHELPAARGCTYVLPASDYALALKVAQPASQVPIQTAKKHLGVTDQELEHLYEAVLEALGAGQPLEPSQLREACGGAVRNLGEAGKKRGQTTTLPLALGHLQAHGWIRRVPINGRLDQQRYAYTRWEPNPLAGFALSLDEAHTELARRYFRWIGPATLQNFQWFSGLGVAATKKAVAPLGLVPINPDEPFLILPDDLEAYQAYQPPTEPQYSLVSSLDGQMLLRRNLAELLDEVDQESPVLTEKGANQSLGGLSDSPYHVILDRGQIIGFWEYDPEQGELVYATFGERTEALRAVVAKTEAFAREQLGDVRSFSLDSPASRAPKIAWLRQQAAAGLRR